jgi:tetratricopeptide (TPR) repeat protein/predicted amidohydrolase
VALADLGKYEEAIRCFDKAIELKPRDSLAWNNKGVALDCLGKYEEAIRCYDKALEIDPKDSDAWNNKGVALGNLGKYEEAIRCYDKAIELNPTYEDAWSNKGAALGRLGKSEETLVCFDKALEINPNDSEVWYNKGVSLDYLGKYEDAIRCFDKAIELKPRDSLAWNNKGVSLDYLGKYEEAIRCYDKAIEINPNHGYAWYNKGGSLDWLGKYEEAIRCYDKALKINPNNSDAWHNEGVSLGRLGKYEEAIRCFDKALEMDPKDSDAWNNKGATLDNLGKYEEAIRCFDKAVKLNLNCDRALFNKGLALEKLGKLEEALEHIEHAYRLVSEVSTDDRFVSKPPTSAGEELKVELENMGTTGKNWVRVSLVQLDFSLQLNHSPKEFGYTLKQKQKTKSKVFRALDIARENDVNIICFPELCIAQEWIEEVRNQYKNMVIVFGSYYKSGFNTCPIIVENQDYYVQKINPSQHFEKEFVTGRCMKNGRRIIVFQTKYGRFVVLVCMDFKEELHEVLHNPNEEMRNVDFVIVPEYNSDVQLFQKLGDQACQDDNFPYILQANALRVFGQEVGGTCIIGMDHRGALMRYKMEQLKPEDDIEYKLIEAKNESMIIVDLDIRRKGPPVPARDFKMKNPRIFPLS